MSVVILIILAAVIVLISRWYSNRAKFVNCLKNIPGPPPLPIIGNALDLINSKDVLPKFLEYKKKYGGLVKIHIGMTPCFMVVNDYKFMEFILSSTEIIDKSVEYRFLRDWLGTGLLLSDGDEKWRLHRKILTPAFHFKILEQFVEVFENSSKILIEKLKEKIGEPSVDVQPYIGLCTLDIICESAMGTVINAQNNSESDYVESVHGMCRIMVDRAFNPFLHTTFPYVLTKMYRKEKSYIKILHDHANSVIKKRKEAFKNNEISTNSEFEDLGLKKRLAFLDLLLEESKKGHTLSDREIQQEVDTFMFAGHDTTSVAISFILYCLVEHPEIQQAVVNELQTIFADDQSRRITLKDLQEMKYLEAVIKEGLRLYPSVPLIGRTVKKDTEYDGTILPEGLTILIHIYGIHRNPDLYPDPEKFIPERFFNENAAGKFPFGYIPFSAGVRNCIGQKFAMLEMKTVLATILRNFELLPTSPKHRLELIAETVIKSANGICMQLKQRKFEKHP